MKLQVLSMEDCEQVRLWRNQCLEALRTPYPLTKEQQEDFYRNTVCKPKTAMARFWGVTVPVSRDGDTIDMLIGMAGIENIENENRRGEISIIINPEWQHAGFGKESVDMLLEKGFEELNLENIYGECYTCNKALKFWEKYTAQFSDCNLIIMPNTKYMSGTYYHSVLFNISKEDWTPCQE